MAEEVAISGGPETAKIRSVFGPALLPIITIGIYFFVWWYKINRELKDLGEKNGRTDLGTNPTLSLIAMLFGWILILPPLFSAVGTWKRMKAAQELVGVPEVDRGNGFLAVLLYIFLSIVFSGYLQNELNKVWRRQPGAGLDVSATPTFTTPGAPTSPVHEGDDLPGVPGSGEQPASPTNLPGIPGS